MWIDRDSQILIGGISQDLLCCFSTEAERYTVSKIHSGGDHSFLLLSTKEVTLLL